jgi:hypothetical protein
LKHQLQKNPFFGREAKEKEKGSSFAKHQHRLLRASVFVPLRAKPKPVNYLSKITLVKLLFFFSEHQNKRLSFQRSYLLSSLASLRELKRIASCFLKGPWCSKEKSVAERSGLVPSPAAVQETPNQSVNSSFKSGWLLFKQQKKSVQNKSLFFLNTFVLNALLFSDRPGGPWC